MKVSFDFDYTLDKPEVQDFATTLVENGYEVWIVTSRPDIFIDAEGNTAQPNNQDLYDVANKVGIRPEHIHFTCYDLKVNFLKDKDFTFHLDDDDVELRVMRNDKISCEPVDVKNRKWMTICRKILEHANS